jgi:hypothetical protein
MVCRELSTRRPTTSPAAAVSGRPRVSDQTRRACASSSRTSAARFASAASAFFQPRSVGDSRRAVHTLGRGSAAKSSPYRRASRSSTWRRRISRTILATGAPRRSVEPTGCSEAGGR